MILLWRIEDVAIVHNFNNDFLTNLMKLLPDRGLQFVIGIISRTVIVLKLSYQMIISCWNQTNTLGLLGEGLNII